MDEREEASVGASINISSDADKKPKQAKLSAWLTNGSAEKKVANVIGNKRQAKEPSEQSDGNKRVRVD